MSTTKLPDELIPLQESGFARWASNEAPVADFRQRFDEKRIPVLGIRHVRQWGIQVDDERELMGHERTAISDEELWEVVLQAKDGSKYEVSSKWVVAAPR